MKKIFFIAIFMLFAIFMVGCDSGEKQTFTFTVKPYELREKIEFDVTLNDPDGQLGKSDIKGTIAKKDSTVIISTKTVNFTAGTTTKTVEFTSLEAGTEYTVEFYTAFNGKRFSLHKEIYETTNEGATKETSYKIKDFFDFKNKMKKENDAYFELANDIDCEGESILSFFTSGNQFKGNFDGKGFTIKNFKLNSTDSDNNPTHTSSETRYFGFFGYIGEGGKISNVTFSDFDIYVLRSSKLSSNQSYYGIAAGYCAGTLENVKVLNSSLNVKSTTSSKDKFFVGGLVGQLSKKGTIKNAQVCADINVQGTFDATVGGVVGTTDGAELISKANGGNLSASKFDGNINVKLNGSDSMYISDSHSQTVVGGLVGKNYEALIDNCDSLGAINLTSKFTKNDGQDIFVGGLVGMNISDLSVLSNSDSSVAFTITTKDNPTEENKINVYLGLLAGQNGSGKPAHSEITNCHYTLPSGAVNKIELYDNENVSYSVGVVGKKVSEDINDSKPTATVDVTVQKYTKPEDSEELVESGSSVIESISE